MDRLHHSLERCEVGDIIDRVADLAEQIGVDGNAVALQTVWDREDLALLVRQVIGSRIQLAVDRSTRQIEDLFLPLFRDILIIDNKQGGRILAVHFFMQRLQISAALGRFDLDGNTGLFLIFIRQRPERFIQLGLEIQPLYRTLGAAEGTGCHRHDQHDANQQCDYSFGSHSAYSYHK